MSNPNPSPGTRFAKGDPRINRKGRPKDFDAFRELAQVIANERVVSKDGSTAMTRIEMILRSWSLSGNYQLQRAFVEIAYGKVPQAVDVTSDGKPLEPIKVIEVVKTYKEPTEADEE